MCKSTTSGTVRRGLSGLCVCSVNLPRLALWWDTARYATSHYTARRGRFTHLLAHLTLYWDVTVLPFKSTSRLPASHIMLRRGLSLLIDKSNTQMSAIQDLQNISTDMTSTPNSITFSEMMIDYDHHSAILSFFWVLPANIRPHPRCIVLFLSA